MGVALLVFGAWRWSLAFAGAGGLILLITLGDLWLGRRSMTGRLTIEPSGRIHKELIH